MRNDSVFSPLDSRSSSPVGDQRASLRLRAAGATRVLRRVSHAARRRLRFERLEARRLLTGEDSYEPDDVAEQARTIAPNATPQNHSLHATSDVDWVRFTLSASADVVVQAVTPVQLTLDAALEWITDDELVDHLVNVISDADLRERLSKGAIDRAAELTWEAAAIGTFEVLASTSHRQR
ncbi:MAG TPA: hypothetical protein PLV92_23060 [Pirellulaceae bacterium]|nr:hypothetical protein [Pirellulaceae bacterium]